MDFSRSEHGQLLRAGAISLDTLREVVPELADIPEPESARGNAEGGDESASRGVAEEEGSGEAAPAAPRSRGQSVLPATAEGLTGCANICWCWPSAPATTFLVSGLCRRIALKTGAVAKVRDRDVHTVAMPYFGGVAILAGVAAAFLVAINLPFLGKQAVLQDDSGPY